MANVGTLLQNNHCNSVSMLLKEEKTNDPVSYYWIAFLRYLSRATSVGSSI